MSAEKEIDQREKIASDQSSPLGTSAPPQFAEMLDKVLSNPQIISAVASALSSSGVGEVNGRHPKSEEAVPSQQEFSVPSSAMPDGFVEKLPEIMNMLKPMLASSSSDKDIMSDKRACLLNAMKPYVSKQRCEAIDYIIKFSRISEILKNRPQ